MATTAETSVTREQTLDSFAAFLAENGAQIAQRAGLPEADAEEFPSWAMIKLMKRRRTTIERYRGDGPLEAFISRVVRNLVKDYRTSLWGRWRPSNRAKRLGDLACQVEKRRDRDGLDDTETAAVLLTRNNPPKASAIAKLLEQLPPRRPKNIQLSLESTSEPTAPSTPESHIISQEASLVERRRTTALRAHLERLPTPDAELLRIDLAPGRTIASLAKEQGVAPKKLYSRCRTLKREARRLLSATA